MVTIEDNRNKTQTAFEDLYIGDCFMFEGELYMVTEDAVAEEDVCDNYHDTDVMNALLLKSGYLRRFGDTMFVEPVDIKITIS